MFVSLVSILIRMLGVINVALLIIINMERTLMIVVTLLMTTASVIHRYVGCDRALAILMIIMVLARIACVTLMIMLLIVS